MSRRQLMSSFIVAAVAISTAYAAAPGERTLLKQEFEPRSVAQIEIGDFHFVPGQLAPLHTHAAPVFGYVSKGTIYYQVEGQEPRTLRAGDAFYEPVGPNIVHFDNASKTEEAVFTDYNFERSGEPFIVFPKPLTAKIDRRSFPSETLDGTVYKTAVVQEAVLPPTGQLAGAKSGENVAAYVAEGSVSVQIGKESPIIYLAGQSFYVAHDAQKMFNASNTKAAKVILFRLSNGA